MQAAPAHPARCARPIPRGEAPRLHANFNARHRRPFQQQNRGRHVLHAMENRPATDRSTRQQDWWWIFDPRLSLRARAALIFGGSAILFMLLVGVLASSIFRRSLERQLGTTYETLAFQMSDKLDRTIYERYRELQLAAALAPFRRSDATPVERRRLLEALQNSAREFAWIGFADATGIITAATRGVFENTPVDARPWFLIGRERPYAGPLNELPALARALTRSDDERSSRFLDLAVPVMAENGQFLGVLGTHLSWDWTRDVQSSIVSEAARRECIGVTLYGAAGDVLLDSGVSGWTQPPDAPAIAGARRYRGSLVEPISGGTTYLTGFARSRGHREYRGLGWLVAVRQPAELAFAPVRELQQQIIAAGIVFALGLIVLGWFAAAKIARRLRSIGLAANRIREGDILTVLPRPPGDGEVARMCSALGDMVDDFRAKQDAAAAERTKESKTEVRG